MDTTAVDLQQLSGAVSANEQLMTDLLKRSVALEAKLLKSKQIRTGYEELNQSAGRRSAEMLVGNSQPSDLPLGLSKMWYVDMLEDNTQLKTTLSKFQSAIDLIMAKHRSQLTHQTTQLLSKVNSIQSEADIRVDAAVQRSKDLEEEVTALKGKIEEMLQVMSLAVTLDNKRAENTTEEMEKLRVENEGLREMLGIAGIPTDGSQNDDDTPDEDSKQLSLMFQQKRLQKLQQQQEQEQLHQETPLDEYYEEEYEEDDPEEHTFNRI